MHRNLSLAFWTLIVVVVVHGPQISDVLVRTVASGVPEGTMPGSEAAIRKFEGVLALHEARHCPPSWLKIGDRVVDQTVVVAPVRPHQDVKGEVSGPKNILAWVMIPETVRSVWMLYARQKHSVVVANPVIRTDILGFYTENSKDRNRMHRQLLQCPLPHQDVRGYSLQDVPPYFGTLVSAQVLGETALFSDTLALLKSLSFRWLIVFLIVLMFRMRPRRRRDPAGQSVQLTMLDGMAPALTMFRVMRTGLLVRIFISLVVFTGMLWWLRGGAHVWDRASSRLSLEDPADHETMHYSAILGSANVHDAFVCPLDGQNTRFPTRLGESRLMVRVSREFSGKSNPLLVSLPYSPDDPVVQTLLRKGADRIPFHVYGFRSLMSQPLLLWRPESGCTPLAGGDPQTAGLELRMVHEADPWAPRVYRAELLGLGLLALLLGGTFGYLWSLRTFRRRRQVARTQEEA